MPIFYISNGVENQIDMLTAFPACKTSTPK